MMVLISYDVETTSSEGRRRLRKIAKQLENYAQRVQNSVFEANIDYATFITLKNVLLNIMEPNKDSLRFYYLGNDWKKKVEHFGAKCGYDSEGLLLF